MEFTIVTALVNINRHAWSDYSRGWEQYLAYMENILRIDAPICVYVEKNTVDFVRRCRKDYKYTEIVIVSLTDYVLYPLMADIKRIQENPDYIQRCVETFCPEVCIPLYDVVVNNKVDFLQKTANSNPFDTKYFIWLDAGYGHGKFTIPYMHKWNPRKYLELALSDRVVVNTLADVPVSEDYWGFFEAHQDFMDGGLVVGTKKSIDDLYRVYYHVIDAAMTQGIIDDDQYFMTMTYTSNKDLFHIVRILGWDYRRCVILS